MSPTNTSMLLLFINCLKYKSKSVRKLFVSIEGDLYTLFITIFLLFTVITDLVTV